MRVALLAVSITVLAACSNGSDVVSGGPSSERLTLWPIGSVEDAPAGYVEYLPPGYGDGSRRPLLVFLHGAGENGDGSEEALSGLLGTTIPKLMQDDRWPADRPFVVLMPQHEGGDVPGTLCPNVAEIDSFLGFATRHYEVDRRRVYLTGVSCGAYGGWAYLAAHTNEVVAGAVLIAGDGNPAVAEAGCALARVPIWAIHGARDSVVSVYGSVRPIRALERCGNPAPADLRLTVYPNVDHGSWGPTYDLSRGHDIYAWLLRHERA